MGRGCLRSAVFISLIMLAALIPADHPDIELFFRSASTNAETARRAMKTLESSWRNEYSGLIIDLARFMSPSRTAHPTARVRERLLKFLRRVTGRDLGDNLDRWRRWIWRLPYRPHPDILYFKAKLYSVVDRRMARFFTPGSSVRIRLDQVDWGGVRPNGIPPLVRPVLIKAADAAYLDAGDRVFGVVISGQARAYPQRIIAWHEMVLDRLGGVDVAVVYCTLCGAVMAYNRFCGNKVRTFGTSGLLYRSNKLMFDEESYTLWSSLTGRPVVGTLAESDLQLEAFPVVSATWGWWSERYPGTTVLALDTGFDRDYREGAAYADYFSSHRLMFAVPETDDRLKNKTPVLAVRVPLDSSAKTFKPLAVARRVLRKKPIFQLRVEGVHLLIITERSGGSRVYRTDGVSLRRTAERAMLMDEQKNRWRITESGIQSVAEPHRRLPRIPAHPAFWFGWRAQFPDTVLIK